MDTSEKRFEQDIETYFLNLGFRKVCLQSLIKKKCYFLMFWKNLFLRLNLKHVQDILNYMEHQL